MDIAILGLWHLGCVYAAGSAVAGHKVTAWDPDETTVIKLMQGIPPILEEGLQEQIQQGLAESNLYFTHDVSKAVETADVVWVTFDTPVDEEDTADCAFVINHIKAAVPFCKEGAVILISSQLPVGSAKHLEETEILIHQKNMHVACSPENLRLGQAVKLFANPDRIICGIRTQVAQSILSKFWEPITDRVEWMSVESAEMTKHAINAFLATSITFANELAVLCEHTGADAKDVERGLKSDIRIGPRAYLGPGLAYAGGTLARDIQFLRSITRKKFNNETSLSVLSGVYRSNEQHKLWVINKLYERLGSLTGKRIALWGLTYKPGTDTLRRSAALEYVQVLGKAGATVSAYDPIVKKLPKNYENLYIYI